MGGRPWAVTSVVRMKEEGASMGRKGQESCILVVEDDEAINHATCSYLEKAGHGCVAAFSGTEAALLLDGGQRFDLVVTDLMLPGASRRTGACWLRGRRPRGWAL